MPAKIERTNTETGDVPACSWFTPEFFEVAASGAAPDEIWISMGVIDGAIGYTGVTIGYSSEEVTIDGLTASRVESNPNPNPNEDPAYRRYWYMIPFDAEGAGLTFVASTDTDMAGDYDLARAVLDRIMATLEFDR